MNAKSLDSFSLKTIRWYIPDDCPMKSPTKSIPNAVKLPGIFHLVETALSRAALFAAKERNERSACRFCENRPRR